MQVGYLGPLEVHSADGPVTIPGQRLRLLLLRLAVSGGRSVSFADLAAAVWGEDLPAEPANALQSLVSRLRRTLGTAGSVEASATGYRLAVEPEDIDAVRFVRLVGEGRRLVSTAQLGEAGAVLDRALALWRGEPLTEDSSPEAEAERVRLGELRLQAQRDRAEVDLRTGRPEAAATALEHLVAIDPLREDLAAVLMDALVAAGRPAEALTAYERTREALVEALGADPSAALQRRHLELLRQQDTPAFPSTNLRAGVTSFVGRADDVRAVGDRLRRARLVTLLGTGGAGKTRLATEVAAAVITGGPGVPKAPDGVWFAELAPVTDPDDLALALLDSIGTRDVALIDPSGDRPARSARDRLIDGLTHSTCLLVVDNCEHIVEASADIVAEVLARCPGVRVLATSREPLGTDGESLYPLSPLALPAIGADAGTAAESPAVRLLLDRALAAGAQLKLDETTVAPVVQVVRRLDGLPLAIELAAARLRALSIGEVAERLADRFRLLTGGRRTAVRRHRTLRAVVEWSWDLLTPEERELAEHFTVFGAGATPDAVAAVCPRWRDQADPDLDEVVDLLQALVDKSLVLVEHDVRASRYRMLETLREYGAERLAEAGTITAARDAHARHYRAVVARADSGLRTAEQVHWLKVLDTERDNALTALGYLCDSGDADGAIELAVLLSWYWVLRSNGRESTRWLRAAMAVPGSRSAPLFPIAEAMDVMTTLGMATEPEGPTMDRRGIPEIAADAAELRGLHQAAPLIPPLLLFVSGDRDGAYELLTTAMEHPDPWVRAAIRSMRLALAENDGALDIVRADVDVSLAEWEAIGDHWGLASAYGARGQLRTVEGDLAGAAADNELALQHMSHLGGTGEDLMITMRMADLRLRAGDVPGARRYLHQMRAEAGYRELGRLRDMLIDVLSIQVALADADADELAAAYQRLLAAVEAEGEPGPMAAHGVAVAMAAVAAVDVIAGELDAAAGHLRESFRFAVLTQDLPIMAVTGLTAAMLVEATGDAEESAVLLGASARLRGAPDETQPNVAALTKRLREVLGARFDGLYGEGLGLSRQEALARVDPGNTPIGAAAGAARTRDA